jgi:hypothetical protein
LAFTRTAAAFWPNENAVGVVAGNDSFSPLYLKTINNNSKQPRL